MFLGWGTGAVLLGWPVGSGAGSWAIVGRLWKKRNADVVASRPMQANTQRASVFDDRAVLTFWFGSMDADVWPVAQGGLWFGKSDATDERIRQQFLPMWNGLMNGTPRASSLPVQERLAAIIVLDQFSRNMFRASAGMFASDALALRLALQTIDAGEDEQLTPLERVFCYLPLEHAEDIALQGRCVALFDRLAKSVSAEERSLFDNYLDYARRHQAVVAEFGRFPHRNPLLGRSSTPEELEYLAKPGAGF
jgi:uncharacterized protein (DUF924 family)